MKEYIITLSGNENALSILVKAYNLQELVRCRDCVYWQDNNSGYPHIGCKWREDETPDPDDFCSAGEHKSADEKLMEEMDADPLG